jgi:hypothetical protein
MPKGAWQKRSARALDYETAERCQLREPLPARKNGFFIFFV